MRVLKPLAQLYLKTGQLEISKQIFHKIFLFCRQEFGDLHEETLKYLVALSQFEEIQDKEKTREQELADKARACLAGSLPEKLEELRELAEELG